MAKKKTDSDSPFVPVEEQPYLVPENWCWTYLGNVAQWGSGGTPSRKNPNYYGGNIPWVKTGELNDTLITDTEEKITASAIDNSSAKLFPVNTVIIAMYGATIGKTGVLGINATTNQACACAVCLPMLNYRYLFYYAQSQKDTFIKKGKGGAQPNISQAIITTHEIPLPPLAEQQRIVDRIESLFAKLDEAKESLQNTLESFNDRRYSMIYSAMSGELTKTWRLSKKLSLSEWHMRKISEFCHSLKYGTAKKSEESGTVVVLRMGNLQHGEIDWSNLAYTTDAEDIEKYRLKPGDILFNRTNSAELVGKTAIYRGELPAIYAGYLIKIDYDESMNGEYLNYVLNSLQAKMYCNEVKTDGVNQSNINAKKIGDFCIPCPPIEEQKEISSILNDFFKKEDEAKVQIKATINAIEEMKKSILSKAFRGELGTNDPLEESAESLLASV